MGDDDTDGSRSSGRPLKPHQQWDPGQKCRIGRDPRAMTTAELTELGLTRRAPLKVIREKCVDCCAGNKAEVRRCGHVDCPSWPYRMGTNPWRQRRLTSDQRAEQGQRLRTAVQKTRNRIPPSRED